MLVESLSRPFERPVANFRGLMKFAAFFLIVTFYIFHHEVVKLFIRSEEKRLKYFVKSVAAYTRIGLKLLNMEVDYRVNDYRPGLIVCNHLSYLDVLVLFSKYPALFITSKEIGEVFLLGRLTKLAGCFHIERRKPLRTDEMIASELASMKDKLNSGLSLFLFPEGTSSDGSSVLPYKAHFFQTAIDLDMPITALCLKYDWEGRSPDEICWYGDMGFAGHLLGVCFRPRVKATVTELSFLRTNECTRHELSKNVRDLTKEFYEKH